MKQRVTGKYLYYDASGKLAYWKERIEPGRKTSKEFRFYHGDRIIGRGSDPILYNLPAVIAAKAIIFTEGEKQADIVNRWGLCGTTFDSGSNSKFPPAMVEHCRGKRVAILRDNDEPGMVYAKMIADTLHGVCEMSRIVLLPGLPHKGDICDWSGDKLALLEIIKAAPLFEYVPPPPKPEPKKLDPRKGDIDCDMVAAAKSVPVDSLIEFNQGYALCLWHEEEKPSLHHYVKNNRVKCFSCGFGGTAVDIVMKRDGLSFPDSVRLLCGVP
jgi:hypothetical protein